MTGRDQRRGRRSGLQIQEDLAPLVERLEELAPAIVSVEELAGHMRELGMARPPERVAQELRILGWLLPLRTRAHWEFVSVTRGRVLRSDDPFIELRATLHRRHLPIALAFDTAAYLRGLTTRLPQRHVIAGFPLLSRMPNALHDFRVASIAIALPPEQMGGLPVWRPATLLAHIAITPHNLHDWASLPDWLQRAFHDCDLSDLERELSGSDANARIRLAYLAHRAGFEPLAQALTSRITTRNVTYLGPQNRHGTYIAAYTLFDSLLPAQRNLR